MAGFETSDDAAVFELSNGTAALLTVDFFTPIVDDPYDFGRITAANALSDVYAMGGRPVTALNMLAFPCSLGPDVVGEVVRGGAEKVAEAGALTVGGHTIDDKEPKYGLSVMGLVDADKVLYNRGALAGDVIITTKAVGTGLWGTALKQGVVDEDGARVAIEQMAHLNKTAAEALEGLNPHALTDITGFGLVGHLHEMAEASGVAAHINRAAVDLLPQVEEFAQKGIVPGRTTDIVAWAREFIEWSKELPVPERILWERLLCDPQTSGGLLIALDACEAQSYFARLQELDPDLPCSVVGVFEEGIPGKVMLD